MSVVNTIFYREAETEIVMFVVHLCFHEIFMKRPFLYYVRVKGWVGSIAKYLLFLTGVGGWFWIILT